MVNIIYSTKRKVKPKVLLPQAYVTLTDLDYYV
jgi:hypothetical protein